MLLNLALKEIIFQKRFMFLFLINVAIGLQGIILVDHFRQSFVSQIDRQSKTLLGADFKVVGRFPLSMEKKQKLDQFVATFDQKKSVSFRTLFSMIRAKGQNKLVYLNSLPESFPFYGEIQLKKRGNFPGSARPLGPDEVWVFPEFLLQMGLKVGEKISIGKKLFKIVDTIEKDPGQSFQMGAMAPKIYLSKTGLDLAGLISKGSTVRYHYAYKTNRAFSELDLKQADELLDDNSIRVYNPKKSSQQVGRAIRYLGDFQGLVALVALFLSCVGSFYLYRTHLEKKKKTAIIYHSIGMAKNSLFKLYGIQSLTLAFGGVFLALVISGLLIPLTHYLLHSYLPMPLVFSWSASPFLKGGLVGIVGLMLLFYPLLSELSQWDLDAFQDNGSQHKSKSSWIKYIPFFLFYSSLAVWFSHSYKVGSLFILGLGILFFLSWIVCLPFLKFLEKLSSRLSIHWKMAVLYITRYRLSSLTIFTVLVLSTCLMGLIPLLEKGITKDLTVDKSDQLPSLFLFDIQDEQIAPLKSFIDEGKVSILGLSPMIRGRLLQINQRKLEVEQGQAFSREEERARRFRNRGANLTYRQELDTSEEIVEGRDFSGRYSEESGHLPELSVEEAYARRVGIKVGDELTFDVLGLPIVAKVVNLRTVNWTSFKPNFFLQFQPGVLDDAPKTWVSALAPMSSEKKILFQTGLFQRFPNISSIDVSQAVSKIVEVLGMLSWGLKALTLLTLINALAVLFSIHHHQALLKEFDIKLLSVLGLKGRGIRSILNREVAILSIGPSLIGCLGSMAMASIIMVTLFEGKLIADAPIALFQLIFIPAVGLFITGLTIRGLRLGKIF
jgi:putative ABC transport system permease protein